MPADQDENYRVVEVYLAKEAFRGDFYDLALINNYFVFIFFRTEELGYGGYIDYDELKEVINNREISKHTLVTVLDDGENELKFLTVGVRAKKGRDQIVFMFQTKDYTSYKARVDFSIISIIDKVEKVTG
ncbi:MAG: hypothetical protein KJ915_10370 [Candidatus Omnitrophica bacterium]|nr:hypothetical protein [Candidatus Omnitrophota bacterium]